MAGPLNSIFAAVEPIITANLAGTGLAPTFGHSGTDRYAEAAPPRIVWVPTDEDYGPPRGLGGDEVIDSAGNMGLPGGATQPLMTRTVDVECDIWGAQRDDVDNTLINATVSAVHDALQGSYGIKSARWLEPEESQKDGETYRVVFQFAVPVIRVTPATTTATVATIPVTPSPTFHVGP